MAKFSGFKVCYLVFVLCALAGAANIMAVIWLLPLMTLAGAGLLAILANALMQNAEPFEQNQNNFL